MTPAPLDRTRSAPGRSVLRAVTIGLSLGSVALSAGCASQPVKATQPAADISTEVAAAFQQAVTAWNAGNLDAFVSVYDVSATFALADDYLLGRAAIRTFYGPNFERDAVRPQLVIERLDVEVLSRDAALVRGIYQNQLHGQTGRRGTTTLLFRRLPDGWRIIHDHSS